MAAHYGGNYGLAFAAVAGTIAVVIALLTAFGVEAKGRRVRLAAQPRGARRSPLSPRDEAAAASRPTPTMSATMPRTIATALSGYELLNDPLLNKGTAFTDAERDAFDLHGLLPPDVATLDLQVERRLDAFRALGNDLQKYVFLRGLQDTNETLFHALLARNIEELMPIVYTPTVGLGCEQFSRIFRKPRGLFLSLPLKDHIRRIFAHPRFDGVEAIVVSDGERILGLGDQGAGGMGISIGKLALYTACAGLHPSTTLPILLDVGTDNHICSTIRSISAGATSARATPPTTISSRSFVDAVRERWPHVLLHWEDFAFRNANRLLARYREELCSYNDDIQGTAAIAVGAILCAINVTGTPLAEQRIAVLGAGSAGTGVSALLLRAMIEAGVAEKEARGRFYLVDRDGLLVEGMAGLQPFQSVFAQCRDRLADWTLRSPGRIDLIDVVTNARPTVLIGTSGQPHAFSEPIVRAMAANVEPPGDLPALQSDRAQRGDAGGSAGLDARPRHRRHRQPVSAGRARRPAVPGRSNKQRLCLSRRRPRRHCGEGEPHLRRHVLGRGAHARRPFARQARSAGQSAAAARRHAQAVVPRGDRRRRTSHRRRSRASPARRRPRRRGPGQDVGAGVRHVSAAAGGGARPITPQNEFKSDAGVMPPCGVHS